ncbi:MAG TPA: hypothetical protein IAB45_04910, partial [Candidatus Onthousia faecavium]|nr:hypothetical protein [Candidatus Onthousia faecavium]
IKVINNKELLYVELNNKEMFIVKSLADNLCNMSKEILVFLANIKEDNSVNIICRNSIPSLNAGYIVKSATVNYGGNGGGSATFAQGGIKDKKHLEEIKKELEDILNA